MRQDYKSVHLRRIHWAIFSPSLLKYDFCTDYVKDEAHRVSVLELLDKLDTDSQKVDSYFESLGRMPMGKCFEQLLFFILEHDDRYEIVLKNHQIVENKQTVGEIDLVLKDTKTGIVEHWEIALKYYLQSLPSAEHSIMLGPNAIDNLARKMKKLTEHQLTLSKHPDILRIIESQPAESKLFMKGQFFYHMKNATALPKDVNPHHETGWWCFFSEAGQMLESKLKWKTIWKPNWIGNIVEDDWSKLLNSNQLSDWLIEHFQNENHSVFCVGLEERNAGWREVSSGFVVNDDWPHLIPSVG